MLKSKNLFVFFLSFCLVLSYGCEDESDQPTGELRLVFDKDGISGGRLLDSTPDMVVISIENALGEEVVSEQEVGLTISGERFILDPIVLPVGDYQITEFFVINSSDEMVFAVPTGVSILSDLVSFSLPIDFSIGVNTISTFEVEVIDTSDVSIDELGYASVSFTVVPTIDILISLFRINDANTGFELVSGTLDYYGDGEIIAIYDLEDKINQLRVRVDYDEVELLFQAVGFEGISITLSLEQLQAYKTQPLEVFFEEDNDTNTNIDLTEGLFAYYPFNGSANNAVSDSHNGQVVGPALTEDRFGNPNSAYSFDGLDDYIDLGNSEEFILGNNEAYSISAWVNTVERPSGAGGSIVTKYISASDNRYFAFSYSGQEGRFTIWDNIHTEPEEGQFVSGPFEYNQWQHMVATQNGNTMKLFLDGIQVSQFTTTIEMRDLSTTAHTIIGAYHFSSVLYDGNFFGTIDEVRFYRKALSTEEINALGEL